MLKYRCPCCQREYENHHDLDTLFFLLYCDQCGKIKKIPWHDQRLHFRFSHLTAAEHKSVLNKLGSFCQCGGKFVVLEEGFCPVCKTRLESIFDAESD